MNRKLASALLVAAAAVAGNAFADGGPTDPTSMQYNPLAQFQSSKSRDQVTAEYLASRNQVAAFTAEDSGSRYLAQRRGQGTSSTRLAGQPQGAK